MTKEPHFEIDKNEFRFAFEICWICKNRNECPLNWECGTIEDMDYDNSNIGDDQA